MTLSDADLEPLFKRANPMCLQGAGFGPGISKDIMRILVVMQRRSVQDPLLLWIQDVDRATNDETSASGLEQPAPNHYGRLMERFSQDRLPYPSPHPKILPLLIGRRENDEGGFLSSSRHIS